VRAGLGDDFHRDHLPGMCGTRMFGRHQDVLVDAAFSAIRKPTPPSV